MHNLRGKIGTTKKKREGATRAGAVHGKGKANDIIHGAIMVKAGCKPKQQTFLPLILSC